MHSLSYTGTGQQRQGAQLDQRLAGAVGVDRGETRQPGVEGQQQVQALGRPDLADDHPGRPHPERLAHEVAQGDLARALQALLPGLHRHPVGVGEAQLEDLLGTDHPVTTGDRRGEAVQERGLPCLSAAGNHDVQPRQHGGLQEACCLSGEAAELDEVCEPGCAEHELANVHGREAA